MPTHEDKAKAFRRVMKKSEYARLRKARMLVIKYI